MAKKPRTPSLVLATKRGRWWYICWSVVALISLVLSLYAGYQMGVRQAAEDRESLRLYAERFDKMKSEWLEAKGQADRLNKALEIEREVNRQTRGSLLAQSEELLEFEKELAFYRRVMAPDKVKDGLHVESVEIEDVSENRHALTLVLTQLAKRKNFLKGKVTIDILGIEDGSENRHSIADFGGEADYAYGFRFFQTIEQQITLPEQFVPTEIHVVATAKGKRKPEISQVFPWPVKGES